MTTLLDSPHAIVRSPDSLSTGKTEGTKPLAASKPSWRPATQFWMASVLLMALAYVFDSIIPLGWLFFGMSVVAAYSAAYHEDSEVGQ